MISKTPSAMLKAECVSFICLIDAPGLIIIPHLASAMLLRRGFLYYGQEDKYFLGVKPGDGNKELKA